MCMQSIAPITLGKPALASNCASMLACSTVLCEFHIPAEMQIIPFHSAGMARLMVDWHSHNRLASSLWNAPLLQPQCAHHLWNKQRMAPRCVALQCRPQLCAQLSSCASKYSQSLNTRSLPIAPFTMSSNTAKAAIVFNGKHCTTLRMLLYPLV